MPTITRVGKESAANEAIGGVPVIHYFDFKSRGRGQTVRLLWEDAGIAYDNTVYSMEEYPQAKEQRISKMNPVTTIPVVELNGRILTQSYAILRHFTRLLNAYDGKSTDEKYFVDVMTDIVTDWRTLFVTALESNNSPKHQQTDRNRFLKAVEQHLIANPAAQSGPFIIGNTFTFGDVLLYQILHDEDLVQDGHKGLLQYPRLAQFVDATEARPNIKAFLQSDRYRG
ncbi:putative Glutathione S-transferase [Seiridium unicorne]|uniref:Glutathione S-transferase n=1 Tax=Seiridium unicorne TaxID=138068 RepID=A0ABR2UX39_9PEZI